MQSSLMFRPLSRKSTFAAWSAVCWLLLSACGAGHLTDKLEVTEGPYLNYGRMSATLGAVKLKDGRIVVIGGAPSEKNFTPHTGKKAIEILAPPYQKWELGDVDIPYRLAGDAYQLPDGRILAFSSIFAFDPISKNTNPDKDPKKPDYPESGSISAVLIDLDKKTVEPVYRPVNNTPCAQPMSGKGIALMQRSFAKSLQLSSGIILRIGAYGFNVAPNPKAFCKEKKCIYCVDEKCSKDEPFQHACHIDTDCPKKEGQWTRIVSPTIEIYTPPKDRNSQGEVKCLEMEAGRSSVGAIELTTGRVLLTGGWGPHGDGKNQSYSTTYILDPVARKLTEGPRMLFPREDHAMSTLSDGRILITGGTDQDEKTVRTTEIYDPIKGIFVHNDQMSLTREDHIPISLGPWILFIGGEVNDKADQIRNTAEVFDRNTGTYISPLFLYKSPKSGLDAGYAGITDGNVKQLDENTIILFGGQQGLQDRDGEYISAGRGTIRTLLIRHKR